MTIACQDISPRRRWLARHHLERLLVRRKREDHAYRAHFWQAALAVTAAFWLVVGFGIHSL